MRALRFGAVATGNMELHGFRCPGGPGTQGGEGAGAESAVSADDDASSYSSDLRLALALSLGEQAAEERGGSSWACDACTVPGPLPLPRRLALRARCPHRACNVYAHAPLVPLFCSLLRVQFLNDDHSLEVCAACRTRRRAGSDDRRRRGGEGVSIEDEVLDEATMTVAGE